MDTGRYGSPTSSDACCASTPHDSTTDDAGRRHHTDRGDDARRLHARRGRRAARRWNSEARRRPAAERRRRAGRHPGEERDRARHQAGGPRLWRRGASGCVRAPGGRHRGRCQPGDPRCRERRAECSATGCGRSHDRHGRPPLRQPGKERAAGGGPVIDPSDLGAFAPGQPPAFGTRVDRARASGADVVYFAGSAILAAAALRREMAARMPQVPLIGTDRLANSQFAKAAGASARGCYYTVVGPFPPQIHEAVSVSRAYRQAYGGDLAPASLAAFDATTLLIDALRRAIDDAGGKLPSRLQVLREVAKTTNYAGAMGMMSFDSHGDTSLKLVIVYQWLAATEPSGQVVAQLTVN